VSLSPERIASFVSDEHRNPVSGATTVTVQRPVTDAEAYLLVLGKGGARTLPLPAQGHVDIGREASCFVALDDDSVSRLHARLQLGETARLHDLGSKNGTRLEGKQVEGDSVEVRAGALIEVGDVTLVLQRGAPPSRVEAEDSDSVVASEAMRKVLRAVRCVARDDITVLLLGETGVGKEVTAEGIHRQSPRAGKPFVRVHCAAITDTLFESELFGHEKGAYTGATTAKAGLLESADGGTVFIDEVGELPAHVQVKLLRVLEDCRVRRVGGTDERKIDVRFVAATNRNLEEEVAEGRFRRDLYFRLSGFTIRIPPLRDRQEELEPLVREFVAELCVEKGWPQPTIEPELVAALHRYSWPGNVRELKNVVRRVLIVSDGSVLRAADLPHEEMSRRAALMMDEPPPPSLDSPDEKTRILAALEQSGGNQTEAAKLLGVSRRTLIARLDKYDVPRPRKKT